MELLPCGTCGQLIALNQIKYWVPDQSIVFCDAKCSLEHFQNIRKTEE